MTSNESDREIQDILQKFLKKLLEKAQKREPSEGFKIIDSSSPNGIYVYDSSSRIWRRIQCDKFSPWSDGLYIIYFDNTKCPACRKYDPTWFKFVEDTSSRDSDVHFVIVLCDWFARKCRAEEAASTFREFGVRASPTTVLIYVKDGKIIRREDIEGAVSYQVLATRYALFKHTAKMS